MSASYSLTALGFLLSPGMATSFSLGCCALLVYWLAGTTLVREPVLLVQLVPVGGDGDPRVAVPGEHLLLLVQHSPQGMWAGGTHTLSRSALAYLRDSQHQCWTLMALVTFLSRALAVVTMDVLTG